MEFRKNTWCSCTKRLSTYAGHFAIIVVRRFSLSNDFLFVDFEFLLAIGMVRNFAFRVVIDKRFSSTFFFVMVGMCAFSDNGNNSLTTILNTIPLSLIGRC